MKNTKVKEKVPLIPIYLLMPLWFISLVIPNLIYSGIHFADTLHILKWTITGVPVAIAVFIIGIRFLFYGRERMEFKIDIFASIWGIILIYCALQPLWIEISSPNGYILEMLCFVTVWAFYVITVSTFPNKGLTIMILFGSINAAINTLFAELQYREMNDLEFLRGTIFEFLIKCKSLILPTPGNYIGNTAQRNMFALWTAIAVMGGIYLLVFEIWKDDTSEHGKKIWIPSIFLTIAIPLMKLSADKQNITLGIIAALLITGMFISVFIMKGGKRLLFHVVVLLLTAVNFWGVITSTARAAPLGILGGVMLMIIFSVRKFDKNYVIRLMAVLIVFVPIFWASINSIQGEVMAKRTKYIIEHPEDISRRRGIWATTYAMFTEHPLGVGIGQYKWHFLEAQRRGFEIFNNPEWYKWQYTHWAHNEFFQFFCEGGFIGGIMFLVMYMFWLIPGFCEMFRKRTVNYPSIWGYCTAALITFTALFSRPFHRIENIVWICLAIAISNREFYSKLNFKINFEILKSRGLRIVAGIFLIGASLSGIGYISSGVYGNYVLRQAISTENPRLQEYLLTIAETSPITYEETQRHFGYHYIQLGELQDDVSLLVKGFNILWEHFNREPHSEDIGRILNFLQSYQVEDILQEMVTYFKPGTYHLERQLRKNSAGEVVNALILVGDIQEDEEENDE